MKSNTLWCPNCKKRGLNPYNKEGIRPEKTDDIEHLWCLKCEYKMESNHKKPRNVG